MAATTVLAGSNNPDFASKTVRACQATPALANLTDFLLEVGWTLSVPADLDDRAIRSYAATILSNQFGFGEVPDPRISSTWEQSLKNAGGARNLKKIEGSQQKDLWFVWEKTGSVLRVNSFKNDVYFQMNCVIAFKEEDSPITFQRLVEGSGPDPQELPPVYHLQPQISESHGVKRSLNGAILNIERISAVSDSEIDVSSVYTTFLSVRAERSE
ncbi:hypothetical protein [Ruegeria halocynthiae]|uniref:hypothetical protein n=1 Tax=Ruegeria halocynthiae TaxID=985054 RepID=UPI00115FB6E6|nr:hypothetical protein [Ruegeria halocynthiae]